MFPFVIISIFAIIVKHIIMKKHFNKAYLYALFFTLALAFSGCEKIEIGNEEKDSTSHDISSEDIDKNKDNDDEKGGDKDTPGDNDDSGNDNNGEGTGTGDNDGGNSDNEGGTTDEPDDTGYKTGDIVSVSEFLKKDIKCQVWVVGRIVGDCTRSKKYAEFDPPFTHSQAILIADNPNEKDIEKIIPICLTTSKSMRSALNLVDNPTNFNQHVAVFGYRDVYLNLCGIKHPDGYKFPVNIK